MRGDVGAGVERCASTLEVTMALTASALASQCLKANPGILGRYVGPYLFVYVLFKKE
jgi:hypothetical protein